MHFAGSCQYDCRALLKSKLVYFKKAFVQLDEGFKQSDEFKSELSVMLKESRENSFVAVCNFGNVYSCMKKRVKEHKLNKQTAEADTSNGHVNAKYIRKLESILKKLRKRIVKLERKEINFDDEENSDYMILNR